VILRLSHRSVQQMAGTLMAELPTLLVYILLGKFFIGGLLAGSVKSWLWDYQSFCPSILKYSQADL
jgi:hypothetical protein